MLSKKVKLKKALWQKGKSKFLFVRAVEEKRDLITEQMQQFNLPMEWMVEETRKVMANISRRKEKYDKPKYPDSYYADCFVNSEEYKNRHKAQAL